MLVLSWTALAKSLALGFHSNLQPLSLCGSGWTSKTAILMPLSARPLTTSSPIPLQPPVTTASSWDQFHREESDVRLQPLVAMLLRREFKVLAIPRPNSTLSAVTTVALSNGRRSSCWSRGPWMAFGATARAHRSGPVTMGLSRAARGAAPSCRRR